MAGRMPDGRLKVRVAAPPEDGRANHALLALWRASLGCRRARRAPVAGRGRARQAGRDGDLAADELERRLAAVGTPQGDA